MLINSLIGANLADNTVALPSGLDFSTTRSTSPCYAGIRFRSNGDIERMTSAGAWQRVSTWLLKGSAGSYYIQRTIDSGSLVTDAGDGLVLSSNREYSLTDSIPSFGGTEAIVTFEISTDAGGTTVKAGPRSYTIHADYEPLA